MITPNFAIYNAAGEVLRTGRVPEDEIGQQAIDPGELVFRGEAVLEDLIDTSVSEPVLIRGGKGKPPSRAHEWNATAKVWAPDLNQIRATISTNIENERDRRIGLPIMYDGKKVDADTVSRDILSKKIMTTEIQDRRGAPAVPGTLVWRDADNTTHSFDTVKQYRTWLEGLALVLDERGAQVWGWSWQKKTQLALASTYEQIQAVDLTD